MVNTKEVELVQLCLAWEKNWVSSIALIYKLCTLRYG